MMKLSYRIAVVFLLGLGLLCGCQTDGHVALGDEAIEFSSDPTIAFEQAMGLPWAVALEDDGTGDWQAKWFLDGQKAEVINSEQGMALHAGPTVDDDACHAVLWTKASFRKPIKIEYDYTRLDQSARGVNIIYLLATGSGEQPYAVDISKWRDRRVVPAMREYVYHMHLYHISYAANTYRKDTGMPTERDYVRARRYMPETDTLRGTQVGEDNRGTGLFRQGVPHRIVVIKAGDWLFMQASNAEQSRLFAFDTSSLPPFIEGRVGFRQMFSRSALYGKIKISQLQK